MYEKSMYTIDVALVSLNVQEKANPLKWLLLYAAAVLPFDLLCFHFLVLTGLIVGIATRARREMGSSGECVVDRKRGL